MSADLRLRPATPADIPAIVALEAEGFESRWSAAIYGEELARPSAWIDLAVAAADDAVLGFVCAWQVVDACHLLRIATHPDHRGRGIGRALVERLIERARAAGCSHLELEVASRNAPAIALYQRVGFQVVGVRRGYYRAPPDDAVMMDLPLAR